jgi:hypothetical protein
MPKLKQLPPPSATGIHWAKVEALGELIKQVELATIFSGADWAELIKQHGFTRTLHTLKRIERGKLPQSRMAGVTGGVLETFPSGDVDAALETDDGPIVITGRRMDRHSNDPQMITSSGISGDEQATDLAAASSDRLLAEVTAAGSNSPTTLICAAEVAHFDRTQQQALLPVLWAYIQDHRTSNDRETLVAVGAAIRKYIAVMPMDRMGQLALLLTPGNHEPMPLEVELEVAKMIYRNYEVYPPNNVGAEPELAARLWDFVQAYTNPRILLRDKYSAVASLGIEALVAMRSTYAFDALRLAVDCPYGWFGEMIADDLDVLRDRWTSRSDDAVQWLDQLRARVAAPDGP